MTYSLLEGILSKWRYGKMAELIKDKEIILEIGCGEKASFLKSLAKDKSKKLIGIDPQINNQISEFNNLTLIKENLLDKINLSDNSVDCAIVAAVLEHLDYPQEIINEIYRILKPDGLMCLTAPSPLSKNILKFLAFLRLLNPKMIAEHKNYFDKSGLEKIVHQAGFNKTRHRYFQLGCNNFFITWKDF
ncbi:MAG: methyltransferase domain-containing protein [bacterium]